MHDEAEQRSEQDDRECGNRTRAKDVGVADVRGQRLVLVAAEDDVQVALEAGRRTNFGGREHFAVVDVAGIRAA